MDIKNKREQELAIVEKMIEVYCRGHKHQKKGLCEECSELFQYATNQVKSCPHMESKTFCSSCKTHCYKPQMREKIRLVMIYAGPRMLLHHPIIAIKHAINTLKEKRKTKIK